MITVSMKYKLKDGSTIESGKVNLICFAFTDVVSIYQRSPILSSLFPNFSDLKDSVEESTITYYPLDGFNTSIEVSTDKEASNMFLSVFRYCGFDKYVIGGIPDYDNLKENGISMRTDNLPGCLVVGVLTSMRYLSYDPFTSEMKTQLKCLSELIQGNHSPEEVWKKLIAYVSSIDYQRKTMNLNIPFFRYYSNPLSVFERIAPQCYVLNKVVKRILRKDYKPLLRMYESVESKEYLMYHKGGMIESYSGVNKIMTGFSTEGF